VTRGSGHARAAYAPAALQPVTRDFAFIVPTDLPAENLLRAVRGADKTAIAAVRLFDRFESADGLSLALEVTLQPVDKSVTDEQIGEVSKRIIAAAEKSGARLRG
jgi:phenylalanyl-tRNA synthetase beta chain